MEAPYTLNPFCFMKVEDFFQDHHAWDQLEDVLSHSFDEKQKKLTLLFQNGANKPCALVIHIPRKDTYRLRFNPAKQTEKEYTLQNTRTIVMDSFDALCNAMEAFTIDYNYNQNEQTIEIITFENENKAFMKIVVGLRPYRLQVYQFNEKGTLFLVQEDSPLGIRYCQRDLQNSDTPYYSILQSFKKPPNAKYIGFGGRAGKNLCKNGTQVTNFNFDNMRYRQVYNRGALEDKEPLYHSDPFFMETYGVPGEDSVNGIFIDNASQTFIDVAYMNSERYMFGSMYGDLDFYFFLGKNCMEVMNAHLSLVGFPQLKPRYVLGYHQGCYGYDNRQKLEAVAEAYRENQIPIDGLHIDVDMQKDYQIFTIDSSKFPNPKEMFSTLRKNGFKCSTNITPVISNKSEEYETYKTGKKNGYFVTDYRYKPLSPDIERYQNYEIGLEKYYPILEDDKNNYNSGNPYIGEVYYGEEGNMELGTTGHYPDLGKKEVRKWWGKQYAYLFEMGLEFVWQDMTTPDIRCDGQKPRGDMKSFPFKLMLTNDFLKKNAMDFGEEHEKKKSSFYPKSPAITIRSLYPYNLHKATYHGLNNLPGRENKRNFIIGRGCFTGMHRFAGLWTGDNASTWEFLEVKVAQVLALGLSGQAIVGADIGGFEQAQDGEQWADPELFIRTMIAGAFLPWFRNHYIAKGRKQFQEPYMFHTVIDQVPASEKAMLSYVLPVCKHYIELRYRLMQMFYDSMFENLFTGMPITRAMFLNDPQDEALFNDKIKFLSNQFFIGKDFLIAPIMEKQCCENGYGHRNIYLPIGSNWYPFMDNKKPLFKAISGGTTIDYDGHIDDDPEHIGFICPIYVRAGAILPTIELEQYVGERNDKGEPNPITLNIYPGTAGEYTMYLDDGVSRSSSPIKPEDQGGDPQAKGEYRTVHIAHNYIDEKNREICITRLHDNYTPKYENFFFVAVLHDPQEIQVQGVLPLNTISVSGEDIPRIQGQTAEDTAQQLWDSDKNTWYYNEDVAISFIKLFDNSSEIKINLAYKG